MIEFEVKVYNSDGDFINLYHMGPASLAMEIEHLPVGWKLSVKRIGRREEEQ